MFAAARLKSLIMVASLPLLAAPMLTQASPTAAMDACIDAFVTSAAPAHKVHTVRLDSNTSALSAYSRKYVFELTAVGKTSGKSVATATCVASRNGVVISMDGVESAKLASAGTR